jgi:hypothetical protein
MAMAAVCWGWGMSGMNVVIRAFLSREPLERHESEGHGKRRFAHPTSWQPSRYTRHSSHVYKMELEKGLLSEEGAGQRLCTHSALQPASLKKLEIVSKTLHIPLRKIFNPYCFLKLNHSILIKVNHTNKIQLGEGRRNNYVYFILFRAFCNLKLFCTVIKKSFSGFQIFKLRAHAETNC